jgi:hypothetical protein
MSKIYEWLAGFAALVVGILAAWGIAKRSGVKEEQAAETEKSLQQSKESNAIDTEVHNLSQPDLDKRLRDSQRD